MPMQPTRTDLHVSRPLTKLSVANIQKETAFIASQMFNIVQVPNQFDRYTVYPDSYWTSTVAAYRAPATESAGSGFRVDNTPLYDCKKYAVHMDLAEEQYGSEMEPLNLDQDATMFVTRQLLLRREVDFVGKFLAPNIWKGFTYSGSQVDFQPNVHGNGYWDSSTSNPIQDVDTIKSQIEGTTGWMPNTMTVTRNVFYALRNHPAVLDRIKYTQTGVVTTDLLAKLFDVDKFLVSAAIINTAQEGQPAVKNFMASNRFWLGYSPDSPGLRVPAAGYIFAWAGLLGAGAFGNRIKEIPMPLLEAKRIEGEMAYDMRPIATAMAALGVNVLLKP